jgi:hypothetical protein
MITNSKNKDGSGLGAKPNKVKTFQAWIYSDKNVGNRAYAKDRYSVFIMTKRHATTEGAKMELRIWVCDTLKEINNIEWHPGCEKDVKSFLLETENLEGFFIRDFPADTELNNYGHF